MSQHELLKTVVTQLDRLAIPYMLTGSVASSLQGEPRSSHDIDLVVDLSAQQINSVLAAFPAPRFFLSRASVLEAVRNRRMFNLLDQETGDKVDFWPITDSAFDVSRFSRRVSVPYEDVMVTLSSPEDTIIAKLRWAKLSGGSERQLRDAIRVYELQSARLDGNYLERWVRELQVEELWRQLLAEAKPLN
jgi:hypothetical protein